MIIDCVSDLHGFQPPLTGGDLLIVAGDLTGRDMPHEYASFFEWLSRQTYKKKILIAGNHDGAFEKRVPREMARDLSGMGADEFEYLCDSGCEFEGFKIWGSPWTPTFYDWHFMKNRGDDIKAMWDLIPDDTEILITHGPPMGIQDEVRFSSRANNGKFAGCEELRNTIDHRLKKLKLHVFGHIHESPGKVVVNGIIHVNATIMDADYNPVNKPIRIIL